MALPSRDDVLKLNYLQLGSPTAVVKAKNSVDDDLLNLGEPDFYVESAGGSSSTPTAGSIFIKSGGTWYQQSSSIVKVRIAAGRGGLATYTASTYIKINGTWVGPWS